jgi:hypothetical protein
MRPTLHPAPRSCFDFATAEHLTQGGESTRCALSCDVRRLAVRELRGLRHL